MAEPHNIRDQFNEATMAGHPLMKRIELDTLVTLVDSSSFVKDYASRWGTGFKGWGGWLCVPS